MIRAWLAGLFIALTLSAFSSETLRVKIKTASAQKGEAVACRIRLTNEKNQTVLPPGAFDYRRWFLTDGELDIQIPKGRYRVQIRKGLEWKPIDDMAYIMTNGQEWDYSLERWIDMKTLGWWSGDLHIHRQMDVIEPLMSADDIHIAPILSLWNGFNYFSKRPLPNRMTKRAAKNRYYNMLNIEHERQDGAVLLFNMKTPVEVASYGAWHPDAVSLLEEAHRQGAHVEIEKPFWDDFPIWLALGNPHSLGIVCNHFMEEQVMNNEAWGRPRDEGYPKEPLGLALYVMDLYYKALNCGFHLSASAGSASGVLDNPVGFNRVYCHLGERFSYPRWFERFQRGSNFATNGPILFATVNHRKPGSAIKPRARYELNVEARSQYGITQIDWIADGEVVSSSRFPKPKFSVAIKETIEGANVRWLTARAFEQSPPELARFAHTSPFYVHDQFGKTSARDAAFFVDWLNRLLEKYGDPEKIENESDRHARLENINKAIHHFKEMQRDSS